ncbi:MAG: phage tail protein [Planctomycetes bacterium]|nr:phage tail protein [Planctomycetota bacterium]
MAIQLGLDAKLYRNTGNPGSSLWQLVPNVRDVTLNLEAGEADVTVRGNAGWRATAGTLKDASIEFETVWDTEDYHFTAFKDAFFSGTPVELLVMDADAGTAGSQGLRALCQIINFTRSEALEEAITVSVTAKPTYSFSPPSWVEGPIEFDA